MNTKNIGPEKALHYICIEWRRCAFSMKDALGKMNVFFDVRNFWPSVLAFHFESVPNEAWGHIILSILEVSYTSPSGLVL